MHPASQGDRQSSLEFIFKSSDPIRVLLLIITMFRALFPLKTCPRLLRTVFSVGLGGACGALEVWWSRGLTPQRGQIYLLYIKFIGNGVYINRGDINTKDTVEYSTLVLHRRIEYNRLLLSRTCQVPNPYSMQ